MDARYPAIGNRHPAADGSDNADNQYLTVTLSVAAWRRLRAAYAQADAILRRLDHLRAHPLSGAARQARSEIGAAVAHLDRAVPPVAVEVIASVSEHGASGRSPAPTPACRALDGKESESEAPTKSAREVTNG